MAHKANFIILNHNENDIILRDLGPHHLYLTITNDIDNVVSFLSSKFGALDHLNIIYIDSEGEYTQIITKNNEFESFKII